MLWTICIDSKSVYSILSSASAAIFHKIHQLDDAGYIECSVRSNTLYFDFFSCLVVVAVFFAHFAIISQYQYKYIVSVSSASFWHFQFFEANTKTIKYIQFFLSHFVRFHFHFVFRVHIEILHYHNFFVVQ